MTALCALMIVKEFSMTVFEEWKKKHGLGESAASPGLLDGYMKK